MMATGSFRVAIADLRGRIRGLGVALIGRNGTVVAADLPLEVYPETFAIMCATTMGAATTANAELGRSPPEGLVFAGADSTTVLRAAGRTALLVAMVEPGSDVAMVTREIAKFANLWESREAVS